MPTESNVKLLNYQEEAIEETEQFSSVAYYLDMGLGKTFVGSEKLNLLDCQFNIVVCQHSVIDDWVKHFEKYYPDFAVYDLSKPKEMKQFFNHYANADSMDGYAIGVINYELTFRRKQLLTLDGFTMLLDESTMISNETAKRSKFIHKMNPDNVILLSGTPTGGKYEKIWSQLKLIGWKISKKTFYQQYIEQEWVDDGSGFKKSIIVGYKNVDRLKRKLKEHGCIFMKTEEVTELPETIDIPISIKPIKEYRQFVKKNYVRLSDGTELIGDTRLTKRLYKRQLCGQYNPAKIVAFRDLVESTDDRLIVFYNFDAELGLMQEAIADLNKPTSLVNGKKKDLTAYEECSDSITFLQYQAGARSLNLQKANKMILFTLPEWAELFEQAKKRIHRNGQNRTCFYYYLLCSNTIEPDMVETLKMRKDYDDALFDKDVEMVF